MFFFFSSRRRHTRYWRDWSSDVCSSDLDQLKSIYFGVYLIHDLSEKTQDAIVSYGERLSSNIVATLIKGAKWFDSRKFIKTERLNGKHTLDSDLTYKLVKKTFSDLPHISRSEERRVG